MSPITNALNNLTPQELVAKANMALAHMELAATDHPHDTEFISTWITGTTVILELDSPESVSWMKMKDITSKFTNYFDSMSTANLSLFETIAEFIPTTFDPNIVAIEYRIP
ncbi:hypothetical protein BDQ17DRAFT_1432775 [Cyathus striatus]|nr:hypothetical protein BDQ17DRAFT_1432775 [Cyathus striatus]